MSFSLLYTDTDNNRNVFSFVKNGIEYVLKTASREDGQLFCEVHFYARLPPVIPDGIGLLPLFREKLPDLPIQGPVRYIVLEKKEYFLNRLETRVPNTFFKRMIQTIRFIDNMGYSHGDIKPLNIVYNVIDEPFIIDFGCAAKIKRNRSELHSNGSLLFMGLDAHKGFISRRNDLFSLGLILLYLDGHSFLQDSVSTEKKCLKFKKHLLANLESNIYNKYKSYFKILESRDMFDEPDYESLLTFFDTYL